MDNTIWVAIITGAVSAGGAFLSFVASERSRKDKIQQAHQKALDEVEKSVLDTLKANREEYLSEISDVKDSFSEMKAVYQQTVAVVDLKIEALEKATNKHNSVIERTYELERKSTLHDEQIKVANHRIEDLERLQSGS